jgi:hypothetical protein
LALPNIACWVAACSGLIVPLPTPVPDAVFPLVELLLLVVLLMLVGLLLLIVPLTPGPAVTGTDVPIPDSVAVAQWVAEAEGAAGAFVDAGAVSAPRVLATGTQAATKN